MLTDLVTTADTGSNSLPTPVSDDTCISQLYYPVTGVTNGACTTECDVEDWYATIKQEVMPTLNQEPHDVCPIYNQSSFIYHK